MLDPAHEFLPPASSPTISSVSSSDLDTESTGSFFHDRSTTLGTLMGVNFPAITFRAPSQRGDGTTATVISVGVGTSGNSIAGRREAKNKKIKAAAVSLVEQRWRWWRLCGGEDSKPSSLGEFLEVERRFGEEALFGAELGSAAMVVDSRPRDGRLLFADGRVLPPPSAAEADDRTSTVCSLCNFHVSLAGICSGGAG